MQGIFSFVRTGKATTGDVRPAQKVRPTLRDFQRQKLYRFEEHLPMKHPFNVALSLAGCTELARRYNPEIDVRDGRGRRHAGASYQDNLITLPRWSRQTVIVLHEVAHTLVDDTLYPHHGAEFVGLFIGLLAREGLGTVESNSQAARQARLKLDPIWIARSRVPALRQISEQIDLLAHL